MKLNIKELLDFFDNAKDSEKGDASAFMAILGEDLNASAYGHFRNNKVKILNDSVLPGTNKGQRLDRWIVDNKILYQCEIKNWGATAIGGKRLKSDASDEEIKEIVEYYLDRELKNSLSNKGEYPNRVTKVLLKMKSPKGYEKLKIEPLLIYWMPISFNKNGLEPLSVVSIKSLDLPIEKIGFSKLNIFSVSLYFRQLYKNGRGKKFIDLDMPHLEHRIKILNKFQNN